MAQSGLLIQRKGDLEPLILDCTVDSSTTLQAEVTTNPVEANNGDITDHRRTQPIALRFTSVLVNESDPLAAAVRGVSSFGDDPDPLRSARENGPQVDLTAALKKLAKLQLIHKNTSETVEVITEFDIIPNAVLESLEYKTIATSYDSISGQNLPSAIEVRGVFREIRFAVSETVELPAEPVKRQAGKKKNAGTVQGKPASDEMKSKSKSILKALTGGLQ
jgi:hypothetical protein